jgi:uncharacterized protein YajQ (UPF0234 family)
MTTKEQVLDRAITDIQNEIMYAWKSVMKYEQQLSDMTMDEEDKKILRLLIENEKSKVETKSAILDKITPPAPAHEEIEDAKAVLRSAGYHVDSLWHVKDVTRRFECEDDEAYELLSDSLEQNVERTFEIIAHQAIYERELKEKNNDL